MKKLLIALLMLTFFVSTAKTFEPIKSYDVKETITYYKQSRTKTVKVKSYKKKNGTVVKAHKRRAPRKR